MKNKTLRPDHILDYFRAEWFPLTLVTITGIIYNFGLLAGPWFEGKLAECLLNILKGTEKFPAMGKLAIAYVVVIGIVQIARYFKRFYVRRFANNVNRRMKKILYASVVRKDRTELEREGTGNIITKAISDVDDCVEGMRKFTTEIFDTGVALLCYIGMLLVYDWRLGLLCLIFPPISYFIAEKMKRVVQRTGAAFKVRTGELSAATLDRATNGITYRVYGCEEERAEDYEEKLTNYEKAAIQSGIWGAAPQPIYQVISMVSVLFIFCFGAKNVLHTGWTEWDIAAFTTFTACYAKMSVKSSKAAKLFNSVHKAQVSWKRIRPFMETQTEEQEISAEAPDTLTIEDLSFAYPGGTQILSDVSFTAKPGEIIGVTGTVACGKSTLGKTFLCEYPYEGSIRFGGRELRELNKAERRNILTYLGHDPELRNDSVKNNILMGNGDDAEKYLKLVCLDGEVSEMEQGADTMVGSGGVRLSGGQSQRLALARTLCHRKPVIILDDPFSALDRKTERESFENLKREAGDSIILLISHRLYLFPQTSQVLWMEDGRVTAGTHEQLLRDNPQYAKLYHEQEGGSGNENE